MFLVLDLETTSNTVNKRKGNFMFNAILCSGYKYQGKDVLTRSKDTIAKSYLRNVSTLIGHNLKYDLLYLWKNEELQNAFKNGLKIWDTQLTEYILSGQRHKYPGLRDIAVNVYKCPERTKHIEEGFKLGLKTQDMDISVLVEDVKNDVLDTETVALQQAKLAVYKEKNERLIKAQMDAVLCTTEMEFNGMYINKDILQNNKEILFKELSFLEIEIGKIALKTDWPEYIQSLNLSSPTHLSKLFFGGKIKYIGKEEMGKYKSGKREGAVKYKNVNKVINLKGFGLEPLDAWKGTKEGVYSVNESILKILAKKKDTAVASELANKLLRIRYLNRQIDTYYTATNKLLTEFDSCVHAQLCHCGYESGNSYAGGTGTGRLSSTAPNIQNQPRSAGSKVKQHFTSRFGDLGVILEFDYKQLEVGIFAFLTQDPQLLKDIREGVDIHIVLASRLYEIAIKEVTKEQRQAIKPCTFHVIYGGGYKSLSVRTKLDKDLCKKFIDTFYDRYPIAKLWQDNLVQRIESTRKFNGKKTKLRQVDQEEAYFQSCTGRKYWFESIDSYENQFKQGIQTIFHKPDLKNYPVQGLATGDIVLIMLGRIWRNLAIYNRDKYLLINTVHDSLVIDCKKEFKEICCKEVKYQLELVKDMMKKNFDIDFNVPIEVDIKEGKSWWECGL